MAKAKQISGINYDGAASEAIGVVLITRFEEMCALRDRALDWNDPEGVHDMRVSSRRLRSALRDFMPYLHKRRLTAVLKQIRDVADALGGVRDQDVAIMGLQKLAEGAPPEAAAMLEQLRKVRETIRKDARRKLQQSLQRRRLNTLQREFVAAMESASVTAKPGKRVTKASADLTYREVSRRIINERLKEVEKLSEALYQPLKIKPLHTLRISAKRLRYALELFEPCWSAGLSNYARKTAALQTSLGELHDADIWIETFGEHLNGIGGPPKDRPAAALWLLSHFVRLHSRHLRDSLGKWRDWEANEISAGMRESLQEPVEPPVSVVETPLPEPPANPS